MKVTAFGIAPSTSLLRSPPVVKMCTARPSVPVLVADVLDTLVVDPFFTGMSSYFGFDTFEEFVSAKTPDLWVQFELGRINEEQLARDFFKDRRPVDLPHFKRFLKDSYRLIPGVDRMLLALRDAHVVVHLCSNYPVWADLIEETLQLSSRFAVRWSFVSAKEGIRKPAVEAFQRVADKAGVDVSSCILLDDREKNCAGAVNAGYLRSVRFRDAEQACQELAQIYAASGVVLKF